MALITSGLCAAARRAGSVPDAARHQRVGLLLGVGVGQHGCLAAHAQPGKRTERAQTRARYERRAAKNGRHASHLTPALRCSPQEMWGVIQFADDSPAGGGGGGGGELC